MLPLLLCLTTTLQQPTPPARPVPLHSGREVSFEFHFTYSEDHEKAISPEASMNFSSRRKGVVHATLQRYEAYAGIDSFKYEGPGSGLISIDDQIVWRSGGGDVTQREHGSGVPVEMIVTLHLDTPRNVYSFAIECATKTDVVNTGPSTTTTQANTAGVAWSSPEFPLAPGRASISDGRTFQLEAGDGGLGNNVVPLGRVMKMTDGKELEAVRADWLIDRPGPRPEVELTFEVEDYDRWLPRGPKATSEEPGNTALVVATLARKDGQPLERGALFVTFELTKSSAEPGVCLNVPPAGTSQASNAADLGFVGGADASPQGPGASRAQTAFGNWSRATASVGAFDWGAYGELEVRAYVPHLGEVRGRHRPNGELSARLPKRAPDSFVGDAWKESHGVAGVPDDSDQERTDGNGHDGDGYTLYEEYRGIVALGHHSRDRSQSALLPRTKDLVVLLGEQPRSAGGVTYLPLSASDRAHLEGGYDMFESATLGARIVAIKERESHPTREVNHNSKSHKRGEQFGVLLLSAPGNTGGSPGAVLDVGGAFPLERHPKSPRTTDWVAFDFGGLSTNYQAQRSAMEAAGLTLPYTLQNEISNTVAHELAHSCGVNHHGDNETQGPTRQPKTLPAGKYKVFDSFGNALADADIPDVLRGSIAPDFSRSSGDLHCIMAYNNAYAWRLTRGDGYIWRAVLPGPLGTSLCIGKDGDPPNALFGPAAAGGGACRGKVKLRCYD